MDCNTPEVISGVFCCFYDNLCIIIKQRGDFCSPLVSYVAVFACNVYNWGEVTEK